jgi:hypothetical protein
VRTLERARANGFTRVTAMTLHDNRPARTLLQLLGFSPRQSRGHELEFELELTAKTTRNAGTRISLEPRKRRTRPAATAAALSGSGEWRT